MASSPFTNAAIVAAQDADIPVSNIPLGTSFLAPGTQSGQPGSDPYGYSVHETLLSVENLCVAYGENVILRDLNFTIRDIIQPGRVTGQIDALDRGPQRAREDDPLQSHRGYRILHIRWCEDSEGAVAGVEHLCRVRLGDVGVVAQDHPLFEHLDVINNLIVAAMRKFKTRAEARDASMAMLERFGLTDRAAFYPSRLSGGQRQRVAIGQQMVCSGHLLLMDEPFSGLDVIAKQKVIELIQQVAAEDDLTSIIVTTHDISAAVQVADTVLMMGFERDEKGGVIPGARILPENTYNLMDEGLTWHPDILDLPKFGQITREIRQKLETL